MEVNNRIVQCATKQLCIGKNERIHPFYSSISK